MLALANALANMLHLKGGGKSTEWRRLWRVVDAFYSPGDTGALWTAALINAIDTNMTQRPDSGSVQCV